MFKYFFILGSNPTLSIAELSTVFPQAPVTIANQDALILDLNEKIDAKQLITKLGGTIKIGRLDMNEWSFTPNGYNNIKNQIIKLIDLKIIKSKFKFGISYYGKAKFNLKPLGMEIKKFLKQSGVSSRWVTSQEPTLSSVVVEQNKLVDKGLEIVLIKTDNKILICRTLAVQPFKQLSFRDYGRPARDDYAGMLPPKLAQIMINLSHVGAGLAPAQKGDRQGRPYKTDMTILDPFCGSGTILTEAMLMSYKNLIGSDISAKAVEATKTNIEWFIRNWKLEIRNLELYQLNVQNLSQKLKPCTVDAIITEPYLGPQRGKINLQKVIPELEKLYSQSLMEFKKVLKPAGRIVMVWPVFHSGNQLIYLSPNLNSLKIINPIPPTLKDHPVIKLTARGTIIYGRPQQEVWREIIILQ